MAKKFLDLGGLSYLWGKIKTWVQGYAKISSNNGTPTIQIGENTVTPLTQHQDISGKVDKTTTINGHALSDNVTITASDIGVASGAEVNQNAFSNVKVGQTTVAADSKTDTLELVAGSNVTLTPDATNDKVTIAVTTGAIPGATSTTPKMDGTAAVGTETTWAKGDHVHPSDTTKADKSATVSTVSYDTTGKKIQKTINGTTTDVVTADTILSDANGVTISGSQALTNKTYNGYTLGSACAKGVDTSISSGSTSTNVPTTAAVESRISSAIQSAQVGAAMFQGVINNNTTLTGSTSYKRGQYWVVGTAGTYANQVCEIGDMIFCTSDYDTAFKNSDFNVLQTNLDIAEMTASEMDNATDDWS